MKTRKDVFVIIVLLLVTLGVSSLYDYQISMLLINRQSLISKTINVLAELPTFVMMTFFGAGIYNTRNKDNTNASMMSAIIGGIIMIVFGFLCGYVLLLNMGLYSITLIFASTVGICVCCHVLSRILTDYNANSLRKISKVGILSFIGMVIVVYGLRFTFERIPFRRLDGSLNVYTAWYESTLYFDPLGFELRSMPSFASALSAMVFMVNLSTAITNRLKEKRIILTIITLSWIFVVSISEVILGNAYLSDVVIGILISMIMIAIFYKIIFREKKGGA